MERASYRFLVARDSDFPAIGSLRDWIAGTQAALLHLEDTYPNWTQITLSKTHEAAIERRRCDGDLGGIQAGSLCGKGMC